MLRLGEVRGWQEESIVAGDRPLAKTVPQSARRIDVLSMSGPKVCVTPCPGANSEGDEVMSCMHDTAWHSIRKYSQ